MKDIIDYVNSLGRFKTSNEIIENAFWFATSSIISIVNPAIEYKNNFYQVNYYGITLAGSGSGKSFSYKKIKDYYGEIIEKWKYAIQFAYDQNNKYQEEIIIDGNKLKIKSFLPDFENSIEGTREGLYLRALALSRAFSGSLNLINEEILDIMSNSTIDTLKELYDGKFIGKIIKANINENLYGIRTNALLFGSSIALKRDPKIYELFNKTLSSGMYRRTFIFYEEPRDIEINNNNYTIKQPIYKDNVREFISNNKSVMKTGLDSIISINTDALEILDFINNELVTFSNKHKNDSRMSAEIGSFEKILKLSALHAIVNGSDNVDSRNVEYAYDFYSRCRQTNFSLFNVEPQHKRIYNIIKHYKKLTKSEILEKDIFNRLTFNEDIKLVEELCYRNNEILKTNGSKVKFYSIEPLPLNDLNKCVVSIPMVDKKEKTTEYISVEIPFFGIEKQSVERLITSEKVSNFCFVHFKNGKRKSDNIIEGQNLIGIDVDNGVLIDDILDIMNNYVYLIYTTKSHRKEKNGIICDRFRIILPTKTKFFVDNEQHKQLITNICEALGVGSYDVSTRNIDRLWFTNPDAIVFKNENGELFDVLPYLPDTELNEKTNTQLSKLKDIKINDDELEKRINGMIRWTLSNTYEGNRNNNLFRLGMFVSDISDDIELVERILHETNHKLDKPLNISELNKIIRSIKNKR